MSPNQTTNSSKLQHYWSFIIRLFSVTSRTLVEKGGLIPLQKWCWSILQPQQTGLEEFVTQSCSACLQQHYHCILMSLSLFYISWYEVKWIEFFLKILRYISINFQLMFFYIHNFLVISFFFFFQNMYGKWPWSPKVLEGQRIWLVSSVSAWPIERSV